MGSIEEMPSTEMTSESRDVEMRDIEGEGHSNATEAVSKVKHTNGINDDAMQINHVSNGHMTPNNGETGASSPENRVDQPLPSVENDDAESSSTAAAEQNKTPERERPETIYHSSPVQPTRHQNSASVPAPTAAESIRLEKEIARLNEVLADTSAQAAQKVLKDKWRFFLFDTYDEAHISFILRAGFKNATASVIEKVLLDKSIFRELLLNVASKNSTFIEKVITNATASQLLRLAPERVLDEVLVERLKIEKVIANENVGVTVAKLLRFAPVRLIDELLAERLKTVSAKQLISWLARADRLGYKMDDIIDEDDESVVPRAGSFEADMAEVFEVEPAPIPTPVPAPAPGLTPQLASATRDPLLVEQEKNLGAQRLADAARSLKQKQPHQHPRPKPQSRPPPSPSLSCPACHTTLPTLSGYNYHVTRKPCQKNPPIMNAKWWCNNCLQTFTGKGGMDYHVMNGVCHCEDIARATSPSNQLLQEAASVAQHPSPPVPSQPQAPISSVPRPSFTPSQPAPTTSYATHASSAMSSQKPLPRPEVTIQRPPLHTPTSTPVSKPSPPVSTSSPGPRKQAPPSDVRQSPSELSAERLAALNQQLQDAEDRYQRQIREIPADATEEHRAARLVSLKNGIASKKSQIRRAHGVSLRLREKDKQARKAIEKTPSGKAAREQRLSMTSMASMTSTPPAAAPMSSFSPINTPPPTAPTPDYGLNSNPPPPSQDSRYNGPSQNPPQPSQASRYNGPSQNPPQPSQVSRYNLPSLLPPQRPHVSPYGPPPAVPSNASSYRPPPVNASDRVQNPYMPHDPNTLSHALERPRPSGFGVLRVQDLSKTAPTSNKRRRSQDDEGRPVPPRTMAIGTPNIDRILAEHNQAFEQARAQVVIGGRVEDATKRAQTASSATAPRDTSMTDVPRDPKSKNTLATAIMISSSSESDSDIPAEPKAKTTESESEAEERKRGSAGPRRGFMAKRGGKH
jgi:hypothetical protein